MRACMPSTHLRACMPCTPARLPRMRGRFASGAGFARSRSRGAGSRWRDDDRRRPFGPHVGARGAVQSLHSAAQGCIFISTAGWPSSCAVRAPMSQTQRAARFARSHRGAPPWCAYRVTARCRRADSRVAFIHYASDTMCGAGSAPIAGLVLFVSRPPCVTTPVVESESD